MSNNTTSWPNTSGLIAHAQRKSQETRLRVYRVIDQLLKEQFQYRGENSTGDQELSLRSFRCARSH